KVPIGRVPARTCAQYAAFAVELTRIHPDPGRIGVAEAASALRQDGRPHDGRPHVALNFAATLDGRITIGGRSGPIGNEVDRELFHELRAQVDAVMVGAGTAVTERYGRLVRDPDRRGRRSKRGSWTSSSSRWPPSSPQVPVRPWSPAPRWSRPRVPSSSPHTRPAATSSFVTASRADRRAARLPLLSADSRRVPIHGP